MKVQFTVTNQHIESKTNGKIVADSKNYLEAVFFFVTSEWENIVKTVVFRTKIGTYNVVLDGDSCFVPPECVIAGETEVSVFGGDRVTTDVAKVKIFPSGYRIGETPLAPTPDVYAQITEKLNKALEGAVSKEDIEFVVKKYLEENPVETITEDRVREIIDEVISGKEDTTNPDKPNPEPPEENGGEDQTETGIEVQSSDEAMLVDLVTECVRSYFVQHAGEFKGEKGDPGESLTGPVGEKGEIGPKGDPGEPGKDAIKEIVSDVVQSSDGVCLIHPNKLYFLGVVGSEVTCEFRPPENISVENQYVVVFTAKESGEAPLFKVSGSEEYFTPRIIFPIVSGEKYRASYEWTEGVLRIV